MPGLILLVPVGSKIIGAGGLGCKSSIITIKPCFKKTLKSSNLSSLIAVAMTLFAMLKIGSGVNKI